MSEMPASLDCILCFLRQSLEAARFATEDESQHVAVIKQALDLIRDKGFSVIPPILAQEIHRIVRKETSNPDPYAVQKREANNLMLTVQDSLREQIRQSNEPLSFAVKVAIAGNSIDYAVRGDWNRDLLLQTVESTIRQPINGGTECFVEAIKKAKQILYLLDNSGEIVCDQLLIEEIKRFRPDVALVAVAHGSAVLNDATLEDVRQTGLDKVVSVIDNGNDAPGTVLEQCSAEFMETFANSDTIIAKGLANYETLIEYDAGRLPQTVCYLFKAKCPFIAKCAGVAVGDLVVRIKLS